MSYVGELSQERYIKKGKVKIRWWVIHETSRHLAPSNTHPSYRVEVLLRRSLAEIKLEKALEKRGIKFVTQKRIRLNGGSIIVDFLVEDKLVVECEGRIHQRRKLIDDVKQKLLENLGFSIIRFTNIEIFDHVGICVDKIQKTLESWKLRAGWNSEKSF